MDANNNNTRQDITDELELFLSSDDILDAVIEVETTKPAKKAHNPTPTPSKKASPKPKPILTQKPPGVILEMPMKHLYTRVVVLARQEPKGQMPSPDMVTVADIMMTAPNNFYRSKVIIDALANVGLVSLKRTAPFNWLESEGLLEYRYPIVSYVVMGLTGPTNRALRPNFDDLTAIMPLPIMAKPTLTIPHYHATVHVNWAVLAKPPTPVIVHPPPLMERIAPTPLPQIKTQRPPSPSKTEHDSRKRRRSDSSESSTLTNCSDNGCPTGSHPRKHMEWIRATKPDPFVPIHPRPITKHINNLSPEMTNRLSTLNSDHLSQMRIDLEKRLGRTKETWKEVTKLVNQEEDDEIKNMKNKIRRLKQKLKRKEKNT
jgi:flagellar motor switch/type III secretory pathway protein FliN